MQLLTEKEQKVILLYYYEDLTLKEISGVLEVSESRISQLHTKALQKMKKKNGTVYEYFDRLDGAGGHNMNGYFQLEVQSEGRFCENLSANRRWRGCKH